MATRRPGEVAEGPQWFDGNERPLPHPITPTSVRPLTPLAPLPLHTAASTVVTGAGINSKDDDDDDDNGDDTNNGTTKLQNL